MNATTTTVPDLTEFDIILVNTSAGKDSEVMLHVVHEMAVAAGVSDRIVAVHADLGRVEWPGTRELAERQVARYGYRMEVVRRTDEADLLTLIERRGMWPSSSARFCTSDSKRAPIRKLMTALADEHRAKHGHDRPVRILNCMGLRAAESSARAKKVPFEFDKSASTQSTRHVFNWLPIFGLSDQDVWAMIHGEGLEYHYAYDLPGVSRLSCVMCVLGDNAQLRAGIKANPELARQYADAERSMGHLFKHKTSIAVMVDEILGESVPVTIGRRPLVAA